MEVYYCTKLQGKTGSQARWSRAPGYPALLAVPMSPYSVGIFNEEGRPLDPNNELTIRNIRGSDCMQLAWHPLLPLLAIGWKDGAISFWNAEERHLEEDSKTHRNPLSCMLWNQSGDRLFTSDENGKLAVWKTDRLMRPIHVVSYDEQPGCKIRTVVLGPTEISPDSNMTATIVYYGVNQNNTTVLKWANDQGYTGVVQELTEEVHNIIYYAEKEQLVVTTSGCTLHVLGRNEQLGTWQSISKMKFATGTGEAATALQVCWACDHTLASASERDNVVRLYNFDTEDNYVLTLDAAEGTGNVTRIVCLASDLRCGLLAAGTADGRVTVFKYNAPSKEGEPVLDFARCWEQQPAFQVGNRALSMEWGPNPRLMAVVSPDGVNACRKTLLNHRFRDNHVVIQTGVDRLVVESVDPDQQGSMRAPGKLTTKMQILGLDISKGMMLVYDGTRGDLFKVTDTNDVVESGSFETTSRAMAIQNDSIFRAADNRIEVCNTAGTVKQTLAFDEIHGTPVLLDICRDYLGAVTQNNYVRVFKVAGREAKPHAGPGLLIPAEFAHLKIDQIRVNATGTMVSALVSSKDKSREHKMFVYCSENNSTLMYDFAKDNRTPQVMAWDVVEGKLLSVQTLAQARDDLLDVPSSGHTTEVGLMFVSPEHGVLMQEYQDIDKTGAKGLIGLQAPHLMLNKQSLVAAAGAQPFTSNVARIMLQGFAGMEESDEKTKSALLDFSYYLATGNMDEAFRAVKAIKNPAVWENMAHLCIKNKRLDVAEHCLGKMENARGARAAREARSIDELDARVATVAIHLGMVEDAKRLYIASDRFDLLNKLYRASGQWDKALEIAEKNDRIHLKATHYAYAQFLEKTGEVTGAVEHYEASGCGQVEVPRMYFETGQIDNVQAYITKHADDHELQVWWARYSESIGDFNTALDCYEKAGDALSMVRIYCYTKNFSAAEEQVARLGDPAAAFHLARQYEAQGRITEAIRFYTQAKRYSHGVRLAKKHELDSELMNLALKSTPLVMIDAADYLNEKGEHEKAATLYMKGGKLSKAVEMCFAARLFDVLQHITDDLQANQDPGLYMRCSEFFMSNGHFDKAVKMLIAAGQYSRALELCVEHDVSITEEMAEAMTPSKDVMSNEERNLVLQRIAKVAKRQGSWQLAAKKYTQAGEKIKAMKALLRSGDTEKIIFFAGVSRQKEIYMMAANYLQTLDWHSDPEIMKNIIGFYSKAQAMDSLAAFYEACAQIEIDEYRDYEKALQAMREATKYLAKSKAEDRESKLAAVNQRISMTEKFVMARQLITQNPQQALSICNEVLMTIPADSQDLDSGIRVGDVFALMIEYWYEQRNALEAYKLIEQMRGRNIILSPYLDQRMVEEVYKALGVEPVQDRAPTQRAAAPRTGYNPEEGYIDEEIVDEIVDED
mmetsp:Transcript_30722/g.68056  ORF Transcript_30722/g.68056 Transcript_30722/m.68056 type:complete len:1411 (+) Transcript_30722:34-4266(+)|eukprot:CAMPEP_0202908384 /NCGR_PEP_ID=MMETSP1392-20130828/45824_1 /ASSEMBLY_ACC=CAM_ASM_000868 /TAXON_ID=225041 /ORGANISM="Chlamydomonas chlamydogama, Strain SAG 11-48b" /LENGTH=1410 /DNA_ID=CAMNT_0049597681 /DNA_START=34 /DNA_END=4266 /DNA_ORIENTATION=-